MLTPANIKNHQFQNLGRGFYKTDEVDSYIDEIYSSYNLIYNENKELIRKLNILASKIEEYRNDEQSLRNAILNAQRMASKLIEEARKEAESIIEAAETKAESADSITNIRIKKRIDEVELMIKETFDKARAQAKRATERAENDAKAVITDAKIKASEIIENAAKTSRNQLAIIAEDINSQQSVLTKLREESETFRNSMIKRYEDQIHLIKSYSDFAFGGKDESQSGETSDYEVTKAKVDEIIASIFNDRLSSFDDLVSDDNDQKFVADGNMVFEDIYSSSEQDDDIELSTFEKPENKPDPLPEASFDGSFEDVYSSADQFDSNINFKSDQGSHDDDLLSGFTYDSSDDFSSIFKKSVSDDVHEIVLTDEADVSEDDGIEEVSVDEIDDDEFTFDDGGESNYPDISISNKDYVFEKDESSSDENSAVFETEDPFTISFEDDTKINDTFEFDFIEDEDGDDF